MPAKVTAVEVVTAILRILPTVPVSATVRAAARAGVGVLAVAVGAREAGLAAPAAKVSVPAAARVIAPDQAGAEMTSTVILPGRVTVGARAQNILPGPAAGAIVLSSPARILEIQVRPIFRSIPPPPAPGKKSRANPILQSIKKRKIHGQFNAMILIVARLRR